MQNFPTPMKLIILDRDGVINEDSDAYIKSPDEWIPIPGSLDAIARLTHAGYRVVVATNQSGIGRGLFDLETLNLIHKKMHRMAQEAGGVIEAVFFCPDVDEANPYRKPNPGMLLEIGRRLNCGLQGVPVVGDSLRDIRAARAANARPLLVRTGKGAATLEHQGECCANVMAFDNLAALADYLIQRAE
jgi:D-glycero-D-manno-heptose 1,7-bisphosphate phosphatase